METASEEQETTGTSKQSTLIFACVASAGLIWGAVMTGLYVQEKNSSVEKSSSVSTTSAAAIIKPPDRVVFGDNWSDEEGRKLIFCGHYPAPDIDSVASAIGAAELFRADASIPKEGFNTETLYVLDRFGVDKPKFVQELLEGEELANVVLVDVNSDAQIDPDIPHDRIAGIIDHHGVNEFAEDVQANPMMVLIEPWGSACTIMTALFQDFGQTPTKATAGCLLSGILSDTLNLRGPTKTDQDEAAVNYLSKIALEDPSVPWDQKEAVDELFNSMAIAKANMTGFTDVEIITSDIKGFVCGGHNASWGTVEGVDPFYSEYLERSRVCDWAAAIDEVKTNIFTDTEFARRHAFISFVEVQKLTSVVMTTGIDSGKLLEAAFNTLPLYDDTTTITLCDGMTIIKTVSDVDPAQGLVSRKKDFMPAINGVCDNTGEWWDVLYYKLGRS